MTFLPPTDTFIEAAGRWFLKSGIQEAGGGVARYYRSDQRQNAPVSTEITGYALGALLFLHERTGDEAYLEAALRAARFLTRTAWDARLGTFPFEHPVNGGPALAYFFDCGIIVRGLLSAWRVTKDSEFLDAAIAAGHGDAGRLSRRQRHPSDSRAAGKAPAGLGDRIGPQSPGCYQLKSAMAWRELFEVTGERPSFCAVTNRRWRPRSRTIASSCPATRISTALWTGCTPYAYFLEGLLPVLRSARVRRGLSKWRGSRR